MTRSYRRAPLAHPDVPLRQDGLRNHNLALIFQRIQAAGAEPVSRTDLAATTGLTRATVTRIVDDLLAGELVVEVGPAYRSGAGRPPVGLVLSRRGPAGIGLDIKGDYLAACVVDLTGTVRHHLFEPGDQAARTPAQVLANAAQLARKAIAAAAAEDLTVVAATMAVPGVVADGGLVRFSPYLGWRDVDVCAPLRTGTNLPVTAENQANVAALAELHSGDSGLSSFIYVSGELGLGAGIVLDGQLMRGVHGWSGELGHVVVNPAGPRCRCGSTGCLETYASLDAIRRAGRVPTSSSGTYATAIAALADAGSARTLVGLHRAANALGIALAGLVSVLDIGTILLGGSYAVLSSWLIREVKSQVDRRALPARWSTVDVRSSLLGADAAVVGAALTAIDTVRRNPQRWLALATHA